MKLSERLRTFAAAKYIQLHEHKKATVEAADLLDECERALTAVRADLVYAYEEVDENLSVIDRALDKLRAQEKADD